MAIQRKKKKNQKNKNKKVIIISVDFLLWIRINVYCVSNSCGCLVYFSGLSICTFVGINTNKQETGLYLNPGAAVLPV